MKTDPMIIYILAVTSRFGKVLDIGPEVYAAEADAWAAADMLNEARRIRGAGDFVVIPRRLRGDT